MKDIFKTDRLKKMQYRSHEVVPKLRFIGLCDRGALRRDRLCLTTPASASPDCKLAHNCVNNCIVSVKYRRAFCVMHGLRS